MSENKIESNENHASYKLITEELVRNGLQKDKGKNAELLSWEVKDFTNKGDGYTCIVTSVTVKYKINEIKSIVSYVVKINPQRPPSPMTDLMKEIYPREIVILTDVVGGMSKHLERLGLPPIKTPKVYASNMEMEKKIFVAENLRTKGFQMHYDRRKGQDIHHALLAMEELGRFHSSSLLLKESIAPKTFVETFEYFEEQWFDYNHKSYKVFETMSTAPAKATVSILNTIPKYEKCVKWINANLENLGRYFVEAYKPSKQFEVLVHGDWWTNNMLFKYNSTNIPVDIRFLDLQCSRMATPAADINYYVYSSLTEETRSKYFQKLLRTYYESFSKVINLAQKEMPFTFRELEDEVEKRKIIGLIIGLDVISALLYEGDDEVVDFGVIKEDDDKEFVEKQKKIFEKIFERGGHSKDRFLYFLDEMLESGMFD